MAQQVKKTDNQVSKEDYLKFMGDVSAAKQKMDDASTGNATEWKRADNLGIHKAVAKLILRLRKMDTTKRDDFLRSLRIYLNWEDFGEQLDLLDAKPTNDNRDHIDMFRQSLAVMKDDAFEEGHLILVEDDSGDWLAFSESAKYMAEACGRPEDVKGLNTPDIGEVMMLIISGETLEQNVKKANKAGQKILLVDVNDKWEFSDPAKQTAKKTAAKKGSAKKAPGKKVDCVSAGQQAAE